MRDTRVDAIERMTDAMLPSRDRNQDPRSTWPWLALLVVFVGAVVVGFLASAFGLM